MNDANNAGTLAPCPFCGGEADFVRKGTARQSCVVACLDCGARLETGEVWTSGRAWNERAALPTPNALDEAAIRKDEREKCLNQVCESLFVLADGWKEQPGKEETATAVSNAAVFICGKERAVAMRQAAMKLSQLIASYGDDRVQFQNLDQSILYIDMKRGVSKITFGTEQPVNPDGPDKLGLVVWLDRERVKEIVANHTEGKPSATSKVMLLLKMIHAAGGKIDATENPHSLLNYFCDDRCNDTDTFNLAIEQGLIQSSFNDMFETSRAWLTPEGRRALEQSQSQEGK